MKNKQSPLVSCIMPTANRPQFIKTSIRYFLDQDYPNLELIIIDDGEEAIAQLVPDHPSISYFFGLTQCSIGTKRNEACEKAKGEIIVHWDDDDAYAPDWVSYQVNALISSNADICGLNKINFLQLENTNSKWYFEDDEQPAKWLYGGTLCYWKSFWKKHPFKNMQAGEDNDFITSSAGIIYAHDYSDGYLGIYHQDNIGIVPFENPKEKIQVMKWMKAIPPPIQKEFIPPTNQLSELPTVTCIMPTANRGKFIPFAISYFLSQDYVNAELVIIDDGKEEISNLIPVHPKIKYFYYDPIETLGEKRNIACKIATGDIIMHWDDDDWYGHDWITQQVTALINSGADISGLDQIQFFSPIVNKFWMTKNYNSKRPWVSGATLVYWKHFWEKHLFKSLHIGEDDDFIRSTRAKVFAHDYYSGFIGNLHAKNTSMKVFENPRHKSNPN